MHPSLLETTSAIRSPFAIAAERLTPDSRLAELDRERVEAYADIGAFAAHAHFQDADGKDITFRGSGWAWQWMLLALWAVTKLSVVLKARQLGVSWLVAMFALWIALRRPGQTVLLISRRQDDADKLLAKVAYIYERLPEWRPRANVAMRSITFHGTGSVIESMPAHENIGRSRTANLVVLDEHGHQPFARKILAAIKGAAERGQVISVGTGNGIGTLHAQLYLGAKRETPLAMATTNDGARLPILVTRDVGPNGWRGVFIPFSAHPERDAAWRRQARAELEELSDAEFTQEYPDDDVEALLTTGRPVFRFEDIRRQPIEEPAAGHAEPGLHIYRESQVGHEYVIGADVAEGLERSDWSSATVIDRESGEQCAQLRGRWAPDIYAARLDRLARHYAKHAGKDRSAVIVAVERNNHGHACILRLGQLHAGTGPYAIYRAKDKRLGWITTSATRPVLVDQLEAALRLEAIRIHDAETASQFAAFTWSDDGKPEAAEGQFDDDVLAYGIAWEVRRRTFGRVLTMRRKAA
jgi:hypothetical protein